MLQLKDISVGSNVKGIVANETVNIIAVQSYGPDSMEVTYKTNNGTLGSQILRKEDEARLQIEDKRLPWSFEGNGDQMRLASEAYRISLAYFFDPYLAVHTSAVEPLPHQISAVYQEMLPRIPLRYILADDPGAGKTIMTGLLIKEMIARGALKRCMIVAPGSLVEQWQDEMFNKFHLQFEIITNDKIELSVTGNIFREKNLCICRLDKLARNDNLQTKLEDTEWDLIVCDEAHKMSAKFWGGEVKYTRRFILGRLLSTISENYLLLTATPHNGNEEDFRLFLSLIDLDRFGGIHNILHSSIDVSDVMRRLVKEELLKFDGTPLFPERVAYTVNYELSPLEIQLYNAVTEYVKQEFNRADNLNNKRKNTVGFALTILQRRLASSPEAIYQSLHRRRKKLEHKLAEGKNSIKRQNLELDLDFENYDFDDLLPEEQTEIENNVIDSSSAAVTNAELEAEIRTLKDLEQIANKVRESGKDRKWDELSKLLQENDKMFNDNNQREKLIIFTEHKDTLNYLTGKIRTLLGNSEAVICIHGGMSREERHKAELQFRQDTETRVLIATDAAGEGINLQRAHLMINYDLPWNPNRLEQRFGRIHRIGQTEVCHLWNLVAAETREGAVFQRLFQKLEEERRALGGKVFDILGKVSFDNRPLRELLIEAIRYGNDPKVKAKLNEVVDKSINSEEFQKLIDENALTNDVMNMRIVAEIKEDMERKEAHRLQPYFIEAFFIEAFKILGGEIKKREKCRYEVTYVPLVMRSRNSIVGSGKTVLRNYERVCFDKKYCSYQGVAPAELICPGHPLLDSTIDLIKERWQSVLKTGAFLIDDNDYSREARLLFYIEDSIQDGVIKNNKNRIISKQIHFVELDSSGNSLKGGYAPYLDCRAANEEEKALLLDWIKTQAWLCGDIEQKVKMYAVNNLLPEHFAEVKSCRIASLNKAAKAISERMKAEIMYWDGRAGELKEAEFAGKVNAKINSQQAERRADEMAERLQTRLNEIEKEKTISQMPPVIIGGALIIPKGLLYTISKIDENSTDLFGKEDLKFIEYAAMNAVMQIEKNFGNVPRDVSADKCGYDIESAVSERNRNSIAGSLRMIEVKGRRKGASTVTVSKNEILTALNKPDQFILALVEVDGSITKTVYLQHPFRNAPDFTATSVNFNIEQLKSQSIILYQD